MKNMLQGRVLILNNSYEPIGTMSVSRAMCKISRAESTLQVLEWDENRLLTTSKGDYPVPSVMRLTYYLDIMRRRNKSGAKRLKIYMRDKYRCQYCGVKAGNMHPSLHKKLAIGDLTLDHIMPASRGGKTVPENLVTSCKPCNQRKADRTPEEARMPLLTPQTLLKVHLDTILMCNYAESQPEWKKYLYMDSTGDEKHMHTGTDG
jgi:5-methylcytosine-specific restriction endonuclease McrA